MPDGRITHDPREMGEALWRSREHMWATAPDDLGSGRRLLDAYMEGRYVSLPERPPLQEAGLRAGVLAPSGAAPGIDGIPYEVLHQGVQVVAHMIGNALIAAQWFPDRIRDVLGPPIELGVWIPKVAKSPEVDDQRPLRMPTCLWRVFDATVVGAVAPTVEPALTDEQAAARGGTCIRNVRRAFAHLASVPLRSAAPPPPREDMWEVLLGPAAGPAREVCDCFLTGSRLDHCPAVFLADQSKAFERLGLRWTRQVLEAWRLPSWALEGLLAPASGGGLIDAGTGPGAKPRTLERGLGMGRPAATFVWEVAFDPLVWSVGVAVGAWIPTYVDDTSALTRGPRQTVASQIALIAAAHLGGLTLDTHSCEALEADSGFDQARRLLSHLPYKPQRRLLDGFTLQAGPVRFLAMLLRAALGGSWAATARIHQRPCCCKIKSCVVPACMVAQWKGALRQSPFAGEARESSRYLGATLAATRLEGEEDPQEWPTTWSPLALKVVAEGTWGRAGDKVGHRSGLLHARHFSAGVKAEHWSSYMAPCLLYPSTFVEAPTWRRVKFRKAFTELWPTKGWGSPPLGGCHWSPLRGCWGASTPGCHPGRPRNRCRTVC